MDDKDERREFMMMSFERVARSYCDIAQMEYMRGYPFGVAFFFTTRGFNQIYVVQRVSDPKTARDGGLEVMNCRELAANIVAALLEEAERQGRENPAAE